MFVVLAGASCTQTQQPAARFEPTWDSLKQPELREGHAQTPKAAKEELAQFRSTYRDLPGWELRKNRVRNGILEGAKLSTLPERKPLKPQFFDKRSYEGYIVEEGIEKAITQLNSRFFNVTRKAVIAALEDAV
jgi:hypothetical protein